MRRQGAAARKPGFTARGVPRSGGVPCRLPDEAGFDRPIEVLCLSHHAGTWPRGEAAVLHSKPGTPEPRAKVIHALVVASAELLVIGTARPRRLESPSTSAVDRGPGTADTDPRPHTEEVPD